MDADADADPGTAPDGTGGEDGSTGSEPAGGENSGPANREDGEPAARDGDPALGSPEKMAANRAELTPMMTQYLELCEAYPDALVLFQVGDFYETFCGAAERCSRLLEITLTKREDSSGRYPMAGIPIDNAAPYVEQLLDAGYRVAVADQVQDPDEASGVVDRAVTRVITPGTVLDDELLGSAANNYLACLARAGGEREGADDGDSDDEWAVAFADVSTGECRVTSADTRAAVQDELDRVGPAEVITGPDVAASAFEFDCLRTAVDPASFEPEAARDCLRAYVDRPEAVLASDAELRACGAVLSYAEYTQGQDAAGDHLEYVTRIHRYDPADAMGLDATALRSLEVFENRRGGDDDTLLSVVDETASALGRRELESRLRRPLVDADEIDARLDAVEALTADALARETLRDHLRDVYDVERLVSRVSRGRANARDLRALKETLDVVPQVEEALADAESDRLREHRAALDPLEDVRGLIGRAVVEDPPQEVTEGGVIREGFDEDLDELRATEREGREWVADLEAEERERTGIDSLKVGFNEVHGYYIEVTDPNLDSVPEEYTRRQTLKNAERFYTPELKRREDEILGAAERANSLEYERFCAVRADVAAEAERVQAVAETLAALDALAALAHVATERDYCRPEVDPDAPGAHVEAGRHPVVEAAEPTFVPNDVDLRDRRFAVITGPNMSGKSTYMRQVALIAALAQAGSFVPADAARLPVFDRVFTRVGASDDLAGGESTFMREMRELTDILHDATEDSLVVLDEVGRGTSTTDGLAIAWAVTEFLHDEVGATTLFATHYHDLTALADDLPGVRNLNFAVDGQESARDSADDGRGDAAGGEANRGENEGEVTFLHAVAEGTASASYGVEVARMAGVPDRVVERSRELVGEGVPVDDGPADDTPERARSNPDDGAAADARANGHGHEGDSPGREDDPDEHPPARAPPGVARELREINVAELTPLEALNRLNDLKRRVDDE